MSGFATQAYKKSILGPCLSKSRPNIEDIHKQRVQPRQIPQPPSQSISSASESRRSAWRSNRGCWDNGTLLKEYDNDHRIIN